MPTETITLTEADAGCALDNHRGHYISRDVVLLAIDHGFIVSPSDKWVLDSYDEHNADESYPHESVTDMANDAIEWLNSGQEKCAECDGRGDFQMTAAPPVICMACSGKGRGPRVKGQNFPPIIPDGYQWDWNDGDFGLYPYVIFTIWETGKRVLAEDVSLNVATKLLKEAGASDANIEKLLSQEPDSIALEVGGFIVEANFGN